MFRRFINLALSLVVLPCALAALSPAFAQTEAERPPQAAPSPTPKPSQGKLPTASEVVEAVIYVNGTREGMAQVRRTANERGRITRMIGEGKSEEAAYDRRAIRGETMVKDRVRIDQKMPTGEIALIFSGGSTWGIINETIFTPRPEAAQEFLDRHWHGVDALLRYKENGSTLNYLGKDKQMGIEFHQVEVVDKENRRTRFNISAKSLRILSLEYDEASPTGGPAAKFRRKFYDYRIAQGTFVPYRSVLYRDGQQVEEARVLTVTFGAKLDESLFLNPEAPAPAATTTAGP